MNQNIQFYLKKKKKKDNNNNEKYMYILQQWR